MIVPVFISAAKLQDMSRDPTGGLWRLQKAGRLAFIHQGRVVIGMARNSDGPGIRLFYIGAAMRLVPDDSVIEILPATPE